MTRSRRRGDDGSDLDLTRYTRVYVPGKRHVAHLLYPGHSLTYFLPSAMCGQQPELFTAWEGTASQQERESAAARSLCLRCLDRHRRDLKARERAEAELLARTEDSNPPATRD
jgi:hypothetical protein